MAVFALELTLVDAQERLSQGHASLRLPREARRRVVPRHKECKQLAFLAHHAAEVLRVELVLLPGCLI